MRYLPPSAARPANLTEVNPPAILLPLNQYDEPFAVLGPNDDATVCFLGQNHRFQAFPQAKASHWKGLAIEDVQFEIDLDSAYSLDGNYAAAGSVIRSETVLELVVRTERGSYPRTIRIPMIVGLAAATEAERVGFYHWRAVLEHGDEIVEIWNCSVTPATEPD